MVTVLHVSCVNYYDIFFHDGVFLLRILKFGFYSKDQSIVFIWAIMQPK